MTNFKDYKVEIRPPNSSISSSVQYFHLEYVTINLLNLLAVAPMLHTLEGSLKTSDLQFGIIHPCLLYLQRLQIELRTITWTEMVTLLLSFPRLAYLTVIVRYASCNMADGFAWARVLQQIKHFEFKLEFHNAFKQQSFNLDSFRTKFWLEEKKWFVTYSRSWKDNEYSMLYSNSSSIIVYPPHEMMKMFVSESTASEPAFSHVHRITINDYYLKCQFLHRYTNIKELYLSEVTTTFPTTLKDLMAGFDTSQIMTCIIGPGWNSNSSYEYIEFLRSLPRLRRLEVSGIDISCLFLHYWPHIVDLKIENTFENRSRLLSSNDIDAICHSFPYIKHLDIYSLSVPDLAQLLSKMKMTLREVFIRQPFKVKNEKLITREWIERNTDLKSFHYTCDYWNIVCLWL
ncbi:unnamed protein product [Rotaria sp. Silwood1]|nr:unnamed protein product [Rotaria sp. Silwood1]